MLIAFLIDQVKQLCCTAYQKARVARGTFINLFHFVQSLLDLFVWDSFQQLWNFIGNPNEHPPPIQTAWSKAQRAIIDSNGCSFRCLNKKLVNKQTIMRMQILSNLFIFSGNHTWTRLFWQFLEEEEVGRESLSYHQVSQMQGA